MFATHMTWVGLRTALLALMLATVVSTTGRSQGQTEDFDGSFLLETSEVISGGYFVEDAQGSYLYFDTENLKKMGMFRRVDETTLRSIFPTDNIEMVFSKGTDGAFNSVEWRENGLAPVRGTRVNPHISRSVEFQSVDGTVLHGRLLIPSCKAPHPVIIPLPGSGPVDRHGGAQHMFFVRQGMAVLSYDKRGYTNEQGAWREPDLAEMGADVVAAYRFATQQPDLDPSRIGILGNSQAGWFVPQAVVELESAPAFLIMRAGAVLPHAVNQLHEERQEWRADGLSGIDLDSATDLMREIYAISLDGQPISATDSLVAPYLDRDWYRKAFGEGPISGRWSDRYWGWIRRNYAVSSIDAVAHYPGPVLWFLGEADQNVPYVATRAAIERALAASSGDDHTLLSLPGAQHSFMISTPGGMPHFSEGFFSTMAQWLRDRRFSNSQCRISTGP